jgi:hypothetical protein
MAPQPSLVASATAQIASPVWARCPSAPRHYGAESLQHSLADQQAAVVRANVANLPASSTSNSPALSPPGAEHVPGNGALPNIIAFVLPSTRLASVESELKGF